MSFTSMLIAAALAVAGVFALYRSKVAPELPASKPSFCLLPKFRATLRLPPEMLSAPDPIAELGRRLAAFGFSQAAWDSRSLRFARGSLLGDFSIKIVKVNLTFALPLAAETAVEIAYGSFAAFDTGDLWQFATELKAKASAAA